jgi:hypothetical protein
VLNAFGFSVRAEPRALVKKPSFSATSAEACVMFSRKPSRTVTGAGSAFPEPLPELVVPADEEEHPAASIRAAPVIAATVTRRIPHS